MHYRGDVLFHSLARALQVFLHELGVGVLLKGMRDLASDS
jgi:hypothetical protein